MPKLAKRDIDQAQAQDKEIFLWDSSLPGFGVRIKPTGIKSFVIQYRNRHGRSRRVTIGRYGVITLEEARTEARHQLSAVSRGSDPRQERDEGRSAMTVKDLASRYMTDHCEGRCKESTIKAHQWLLDKFILPEVGRRSIHELRHSDVDRLHQNLKGTRYNANRVLGLLKAMYGRARIWNLVDSHVDPTAGVRPFRETRRQRFLSIDELKRLAIALDQAEADHAINKTVGAAYRLLILTGARLGEIQKLKWEEVDLANGFILLKAHKSDQHGAKAIPLSQAASRVLENIDRVNENPYVFIGKKEKQHITDLQRPWRRVRSWAGLDDVRIHDLRHTFASMGISVGGSLPIIGGLLGHRTPQATAVYAHLSADPLRQTTEQVGSVIGNALGIIPN
ncbi:MAG: site-specific integrase [Rhodospirillales bacterium]